MKVAADLSTGVSPPHNQTAGTFNETLYTCDVNRDLSFGCDAGYASNSVINIQNEPFTHLPKACGWINLLAINLASMTLFCIIFIQKYVLCN